MVYEKSTQINLGIKKEVDVLTPSLMKIKYGNSYIFLENPKALIEILSKKISYSHEKKCYQLILSRFRDGGIIRYVNNYKVYISCDDEYNYSVEDLKLFDKKDSSEKYFKIFTDEKISGDNIFFDLHIFAVDVLHIVREFALRNTWR